MPFSLQGPAHSELLLKKSRFIGCVQPVADRAAALAVVAQLRQKHPQATHVCWALLAGGQSAANDDGEPGGTAGRPMLEVLRHQDLDGVLATVVRYFGGVKLGAGGLVRAYADAVAQALLQAVKVPVQRSTQLRCAAPYALEGLLRRELQLAGAQLQHAAHGEQVELAFRLPEPDAVALRARLDELTSGQLKWLAPEAAGPAGEASPAPPPDCAPSRH
ncbi:MAG TPA: YigZ family protein [Ramlibacter sp.]|nr:YigZ family protein [Ramlibacter sp.]